jgi:hypothetical protein
LKQLVSFDNWNHLGFLSFGDCEWFNNDDWRVLVEHATNFNNMERLNLSKYFFDLFLENNKISSIKEGDIEKFKSLKFIDLGNFFIKKIG